MIVVNEYTIYSYDNYIDMPKGAEILCIHAKEYSMNLWAKIDTEQSKFVKRRVVIVYDMQALPDGKKTYIDTFKMNGQSCFVHAFEIEAPHHEPAA